MDTKALRQKILDLAIRGKLVPQDPKDEPAAVLLERIRAEKQRMVKDGKLKPKDIKNDTVIFKGDDNLHYEKFQDGTVKCIEDEIPFELPEGWSWTRLGSLFSTITGSTPSTKDASLYGDEYPFYKPTDLDAGFDVCVSEDTVSEKGYKNGRILPMYSVLVTCIGATIGKTGYIKNSGICNQQINAILPNTFILPEYTYFCMCSEFEQQQIWTNSSATTLPILNKSKFDILFFPVPPKAQQTRTVERIKELLHFVEIIQQEKRTLQETIKLTKSKILDLAIRGKLVPQDPNDEPASVLLERIRSEKEELIKQGKIKRDKKESVIFKGDDNSYYEKIGNDVTCIDDEISFDIPDTWSWTRISTITDITMGSSPKSQDICNDNQYIEFHQGKIYFSKKTLMKSNQYTRKTTKLAPKQSVLLCVRAPVGELNITDRDICIGRGLASIKSLGNINEEFIFYWLHPYKTYLVNQSTGSTFSAITSDTVRKILIPLPPLMEQKEILDKIQKVFTLFENLETVN